MTLLNDRAASIYLGGGRWVHGHVRERDGLIAAVEGTPINGPPGSPYLIPGFIDLHVHGGGGADVMDGPEGVARTAEFHARYGTVALCATTVTAPPDDVTRALRGVSHVMANDSGPGAAVLGAHVEGPFVNPGKLGGQPPFAIHPDAALAALWCDTAPVRIMTLAPELPGAEAVTRLLTARGVRVQVGHSLADAATLTAAEAWGVGGAAHLFNASAPITARAPGVAGWALGRAEWAELICDLKHVHPDALRLAIRAIPQPYAVTDCCSAGGCPDGDYTLGQNRVTKRGGLVCLPGTDQIAASLLVGIEAFRNIVSLGVGLETAIAMTSTRPAAYVGAGAFGAIAPGRAASLIALNDDLGITAAWLKGRRIQ